MGQPVGTPITAPGTAAARRGSKVRDIQAEPFTPVEITAGPVRSHASGPTPTASFTGRSR